MPTPAFPSDLASLSLPETAALPPMDLYKLIHASLLSPETRGVPEAERLARAAALVRSERAELPKGASFVLFHTLFLNAAQPSTLSGASRTGLLTLAHALIDMGASMGEIGASGVSTLCFAMRAGPDFRDLLIARGAPIAPADFAYAIQQDDPGSLLALAERLNPLDSFIEALAIRCKTHGRLDCLGAIQSFSERRALELAAAAPALASNPQAAGPRRV